MGADSQTWFTNEYEANVFRGPRISLTYATAFCSNVGNALRPLRGASRGRHTHYATGEQAIQHHRRSGSRIIIEDTDTGDSQPLQREQFEALADHARDASEGFDLDRLPPKADPMRRCLRSIPGTSSTSVPAPLPSLTRQTRASTCGTRSEERKETRLQGLKDRLTVSDDPETEVMRQEVDRLEQEIEELTEFSPGSAFGEQVESG